jgi:ATP synthase F1 gamma subunit
MPSVKDLGKRLKSVTSTSKITKAMKMVAASKLRQAESTMNAARPFALSVQNLMLPHIGMKEDDKPENVMTLAISSDKGLCGGINSRVVKEAKLSLAALESQGATPEVHAAAQHASWRARALLVNGLAMRDG